MLYIWNEYSVICQLYLNKNKKITLFTIKGDQKENNYRKCQ